MKNILYYVDSDHPEFVLPDYTEEEYLDLDMVEHLLPKTIIMAVEEFEIGDRVVVSDRCHIVSERGRTGTVVDIDPGNGDDVRVLMDNGPAFSPGFTYLTFQLDLIEDASILTRLSLLVAEILDVSPTQGTRDVATNLILLLKSVGAMK